MRIDGLCLFIMPARRQLGLSLSHRRSTLSGMVLKAVLLGGSAPLVAPDMDEDEWLAIRTECDRYQRRNRRLALLFCVECNQPVHPYRRGELRLFRHNPHTSERCALAAHGGESEPHSRLKTNIYRAARKVRGWTAELEVTTSEKDADTGRPAVVDVVASPDGIVDDPFGFEVQLGGLTEGTVLARQAVRVRSLRRCAWITRNEPSWRDLVPWWQVEPGDRDVPDLVMGGVKQEIALGNGQGAIYDDVEPFPAERMVRMMLRRKTFWAEGEGWLFAGSLVPDRSKAKAKRSARAKDWCERILRDVPAYAWSWGDTEWERYARIAHAKAHQALVLDPIDRAALMRFPSPDDLDPLEDLGLGAAYNPKSPVPCLHCGKVVIVSASSDRPEHHHCVWHFQRQTTCEA